ncbi:AbiV family abortive infection protein [Streptomyces sp. NPDC015144]|uniref:AbiV family abortive infection protein n=1 Tax=Streptomyces sp. NPDC015144 TaxID=3364944 RepID=UPI0037006BA2
MAKKKAAPDDLRLIEIMYRAADHAERHLRAAQTLLDAGEWPDSFVLATLGFEELGKAHLCLGALMAPDGERPKALREFEKNFTNHVKKLELAHFFLIAAISDAPPPAAARLFSHVKSLASGSNDTKFRGLYVDYLDDELLLPTVVGEEDARWMVQNVRQLHQGMKRYVLKDPVVFAASVPLLRQRMEGLGSGTPDQLIADGRAGLRRDRDGAPPPPEQLAWAKSIDEPALRKSLAEFLLQGVELDGDGTVAESTL